MIEPHNKTSECAPERAPIFQQHGPLCGAKFLYSRKGTVMSRVNLAKVALRAECWDRVTINSSPFSRGPKVSRSDERQVIGQQAGKTFACKCWAILTLFTFCIPYLYFDCIAKTLLYPYYNSFLQIIKLLVLEYFYIS